MSENSNIEWCDHTFNPWIGCTKVSPGCANCYAETQDNFRKWTPDGWGKGKPRTRTSESNWKKVKAWNRAAEKSKTRPKVFCASLADWLDEEVPLEWLVDLLLLIRETPNLDWLLLSKRIRFFCHRLEAAGYTDRADKVDIQQWIYDWLAGDPIPTNVWLGTSAEDQVRWNDRIPDLLECPAVVRFVSMEPLIGPVVCYPLKTYTVQVGEIINEGASIDWIIVGGESGPGARPIKPEWVRRIRSQCHASDIAFFFKQWGGTNKKKAGRLLDGKVHSEFPVVDELHNAIPSDDSNYTRFEMHGMHGFSVRPPDGWDEEFCLVDSFASDANGAWERFCGDALKREAYEEDGFRAVPVTITAKVGGDSGI